MDSSHKTYELTFPAGLSLATASRMFTALSGLLNPVHRGPLVVARRTIAFELLFTPSGIHHLMSVPAGIAEAVLKHLRGIMPMLRVTEIADQPRRWTLAGELNMTVPEPEEAAKQAAGDAAYIPVVLHSLSGLAVDEAAMVQLIVTGGGQGTVLYHARVATAAPDSLQARQVMKALSNSLKSLHAVITRPMPASIIGRVSARSAPIIEWRQAPAVELLALAYAVPVGTPQLNGMKYNRGKYLAPDHSIPRKGALVAQANFPGAERPLALAPVGRDSHTLVVGPNGSGKSTLIENLIADDIRNGRGLLYIDPKGDSARRVADLVPPERIGDVIYFDITDTDHPVGFNLLAGQRPARIAGQLVTALRKPMKLENTTRSLSLLRSAIMSLATAGYTLVDVPALFRTDEAGMRFRQHVISHITNPDLLSSWAAFQRLSDKEKAEQTAALNYRFELIMYSDELKLTFGQANSTFNLEEAIRSRKIILMPLNSGELDELAPVAGTLLLNGLWSTVRRMGLTENFHLYVDEFNEIANMPIPYGEMFAQARGYKLPILAAVQAVNGFDDRERGDVLNNTQNKFIYRPAHRDVRHLLGEMGQFVTEDDLMGLGSRELMMRFQVDGVPSPPATGWASRPPTPVGLGADAIAASRAKYSRPGAQVEEEIRTRQAVSQRARTAIKAPVDEPSSPRPAPMPLVEETGWEPWDGSIEA
ncbi:type IV secretory system conjugative DNA transfer family protein [Streptomyces sp. NPDC127079]|uniref:type IV secretory system conjugative DNA transfer family protein n=1 Tax=Streptomyces sp. NPDC127079 TaxID=3347132 RepID=UPI00364BCC32